MDDSRCRATVRDTPRPGHWGHRSAPTHDLVGRAQTGDLESIGLLYDRHVDSVYEYIHSRVLNHRAAQIICRDTFLHAVRGLATFIGGEPEFGRWLLATADNLVDLQLRAIIAND